MRLLKSLVGLVMTTREQIIKQTQLIARCEKSLAVETLKKRRADTRRKIEFGGLVIKSSMNVYNKAAILGGLVHLVQLIEQDESYLKLFESIGNNLFMNK
jgi:hypothetical protein